MLLVILFAITLLCVTALVCVMVARSDRAALIVGTTGSAVACTAGGVAAFVSLLRGESATLTRAWTLPVGEFHVGLDPLSRPSFSSASSW